ncbi:MAG: type II secretion system F family protein, partial [Candidatus Omnitrophota bacterium]
MPTFIYKAKKGPTEVTVGELEASSQEEAVAELDKLGLIPVSIAEKAPCSGQPGSRPEGAFVRECPGASQSRPAPAPVRARQETRQYADAGSGEARILRVKAKDLDVFTRQLSSLVKANVPILRALSLILDQSESRQLRGVVSGLQKDVRDGKMLSDAMAKYPRVFNNLYLNMVRSGERAGALDEVL